MFLQIQSRLCQQSIPAPFIIFYYSVLFCFAFYVVPTANVIVTTLNTQTVGQSLTLQCEVTTVRGITSRVDIVWSSGGIVLRRINGTTPTTMNSSQVYTDSYTISQLSTTDDGRVIQCEVVINTSPSVMATDSITLDVTGEYCMTLYLAVYMLLLYTQFPLLQSPYHHLVPYKELWWVVLKLSIVQ